MPRIEHFAIFADDLEVLRDFYAGTFDLKVIVDNSKAPVRGYFLADGHGSVIELIERPSGTPKPETRYACHVAVSVDDYENSKARLESRGARFENDTEIRTESFQTGFFRDPDGNRTQIVWRARPLGE